MSRIQTQKARRKSLRSTLSWIAPEPAKSSPSRRNGGLLSAERQAAASTPGLPTLKGRSTLRSSRTLTLPVSSLLSGSSVEIFVFFSVLSSSCYAHSPPESMGECWSSWRASVLTVTRTRPHLLNMDRRSRIPSGADESESVECRNRYVF